MVPTDLVHIVVGPGRGTWDRQNKNILTNRNSHIPASFKTKKSIFEKCKDQNDRIGKIYRFKMWLDRFELKNQLESKDCVKHLDITLPPNGQSDDNSR